ncbi:MAG: hypothetical protein RIQ78_1094 [Bacteroidota bacterium]
MIGAAHDIPSTHLTQITKMSDLLKKFKSIFIAEELSQQPATAEVSPPAAAVAAPTAELDAVSTTNNKFIDVLATALEQNNQEGFDYFEFRQSLINLAKMPMDEATRYKSAFAMAQTMGIDALKLIDSAVFYGKVMAGEQDRFNDAHEQQRAKLIGNREEELKHLDATVLQKQAQITQLNGEIENHQREQGQIKQEIAEATIKIETTKAEFEIALNVVVAHLQSDIQKMKQYLT